ncbi:MAG: hypothetical protein L3K16_01070 [Thermoplasmata archaeon]|nr:hypothetical protein [Thermoplasmata archaeon]
MAWSESAYWMCPNCGTSNVEGTRNCEHCSRPLIPPPPPLPGTFSAPPPPPPPLSTAASWAAASPSTPLRRRRLRYWPVVLVVGLVVALGLGIYAINLELAPATAPQTPATPPADNATNPTVQVNAIEFEPNSCLPEFGGSGFKVYGGADGTTSTTVSNTGTSSCVIVRATADSTGFSVVSDNAPLTVAAGGSATFTLKIQTPDSTFSGTLDVNLDVTSAS